MKAHGSFCMGWMVLGACLQAAAFGAVAPATGPARCADRTGPQCGHEALQHCCALLGVPVDMERLLERLPPRPRGHSLLELQAVLEQLGLHAEGRAATLDTLRRGEFPVIAHTRENHFLVVEKADGRTVRVLDGRGRRQVWSSERFEQAFSGRILRVSRPQPDRPLPDCHQPPGRAPRLQFDTLFFDHGQIPAGRRQVSYAFAFRNLGGGDLTIDTIRTTCRCLQAARPDRPVLAGRGGTITLTYAIGEPGPFVQTAYVHSNDPCAPVVRLTLAGNTDQRVWAEPARLDLGRIPLGRAASARCTIMGAGDAPLDIREVSCDLPGARVEHVELTPRLRQQLEAAGARIPGPAASIHFISLTLAPRVSTPEEVEGVIRVTTNVTGFECLAIPVRAQAVPPVSLAPQVLYFGEVADHEALHRTVSLVAEDPAPFTVRAVEPGDTGLTCAFPSEPQVGRCELSFSGTGAAAVRLSGRTMAVRVESPTVGGTFVLPLNVYARPKTIPSLH